MKAPFTPRFATWKALRVLAFLPIAFWIYPEPVVLAAHAQEQIGQSNQALVFQIKSQNQSTLSYEELIKNDPLTLKLQKYLQDRNSPLAPSAAFILTNNMWERALAISVVESNMCRFTPKYRSNGTVQESYNCSGIGGDNYRRYESYEHWFSDMNALLNKPNYANRPIEKFIGYYVVPGSQNWLNGVRKTEADFEKLKEEANQERLAMGYAQPIMAASKEMAIAKIDAE